MRGSIGQMIQFPSWLGKNSTATKHERLLQELCRHMQLQYVVYIFCLFMLAFYSYFSVHMCQLICILQLLIAVLFFCFNL